MDVKRTVSVCALALVVVMASATLASAQTAPSLAIQVQSNQVSGQWTSLAGATGYTVVVGSTSGASDIGVLNLPASVTSFSVVAPSGTYFMRVRAFAGATVSDFSNEVRVDVGPSTQPCAALAAPVVTASVSGGAVTLNWGAVAGATGYLVQWSRFSGGTELTEQVTSTSHSRFVGTVGTFYARVVALSPACGNATSQEVSFTITEVTRRHLSAAEILSILNLTKTQYPRAFQLAHNKSSSERYDFIILAGRRLYQASGGTVGLNWRRAIVGDLSMDGLTVENPADGLYYFADVIVGAGGPNPQISYTPPFHSGALLRDSSGRYAPQGFANPMNLRTHANYGPDGGW